MRRIIFIQFIIFLAVGPAHGWGNDGHVRINRAAAIAVPGPFGDYLALYAETLAVHAPDPDRWKKDDRQEGYRHYIDIDLYTEPPFSDLPLTEEQLIERFGQKNVNRWGIGPYYIAEYSKKLITQLQAGEWEASLIPLAALGHYVADMHMPLHVVANYNGQLTGNDGIHFRWEVPLIDDFIDTVVAYPVLEDWQLPFDDPLTQAFAIVRESYPLHFAIIHADSLARAAIPPEQRELLSGYDPLPDDSEYYDILYRETGELARQQLNRSATRVAAYWYYCWLQAGSPVPPAR